jgi:hypothetical protein
MLTDFSISKILLLNANSEPPLPVSRLTEAEREWINNFQSLLAGPQPDWEQAARELIKNPKIGPTKRNCCWKY